MEKTAVSAVRMLAVDAINKAKSGHPGICLGAAPMLVDLYENFMTTDKNHLDWLTATDLFLAEDTAYLCCMRCCTLWTSA